MDRLTYPDIARVFGTGLIATGVGLLCFVLITVMWGDPFTRLSEHSAQAALEREFASAPTIQSLQPAALDPELTRLTARRFDKQLGLGRPAGKLVIPAIDVKKLVVNGARDQDLAKGPGFYAETGLPGSGAPLAIAGHRTTHGAPFLDVDKLKPGDKIAITMPYGVFTYTVTRSEIILPNDWSILNYGAAEPTARGRKKVIASGRCVKTCEHIVLTACHPKYSAAKRLAVFAKLTSVKLRSGAKNA